MEGDDLSDWEQVDRAGLIADPALFRNTQTSEVNLRRARRTVLRARDFILGIKREVSKLSS